MRKSLKQLTMVLFLSLTISLIQAQAQPPASGESIVDLEILQDNSIELSGFWSKPIRPWEIASYLARGIPMSSDLVYVGNLSIVRQEGDSKLRGKLTAAVYPRLNPREVRPDIIKEFQAKNLLTKSKIVDLLATLYGEDMLVFYGIETELRDVNVTSLLYGNITVTMLMINATVESSAEFIESLDLTFFARRVSEDLYIITYSANLSSSPISPSAQEGHLVFDLEPIVSFFPPDTIALLKVNLTNYSLRLIGTDPDATLLTSQYAEIPFIPIEKGALKLYFEKVGVSLFIWISIALSFVIVAIIVSTRFFRLRLSKFLPFK